LALYVAKKSDPQRLSGGLQVSAELPGSFGRFEVKRLLGRGAMGSVYLAEDPVIGRKVAIKVLRTHHGLEGEELEEMLARFQREFQSAGTLTHPAIVTVYDVGHEGEAPFIAMEYVRGESLEAVLQSERTLTFKEISDLAAHLCSGLDFAHERNIVHRDIKPANIMMTWDGVAKITDFGVAKLTTTTMTRTGTIIGTPAYMAPEQVTGHPVSGRADQFSVGVILYQLLTGERPFSGDSPTAILYKIVHETPTSPQELNKALPEKVNEVILKSLAKNPEERYETCADLSKAIRRALGASPPEVTSEVDVSRDATLQMGASEAISKRRAQHSGGLRRWLWLPLLALVVAGLWYAWGQMEKGAWGPGLSLSGSSTGSGEEGDEVAHGLEIRTDPAGLDIWLDGQPTGLLTPARLELPGARGESRLIEVRRGEQLLASRAFTLEPTLPNVWFPEVGPATPEAAQEELLTLVTDPPGARVVVNGEALGEATPTQMAFLPGESYEVRVELAGHDAQGATLALEQLSEDVLAKGEVFFRMKKTVQPGAVTLAASFPVRITVAGNSYGPAATHRISLPPGSYRAQLAANEVFFRSTQQITVESGGEVSLQTPDLVLVTLTAVPGNCRVSIDGREVDATPIRDLPVVAGSHQIKFFWPALDSEVVRTEVISSENARISARPGK